MYEWFRRRRSAVFLAVGVAAMASALLAQNPQPPAPPAGEQVAAPQRGGGRGRGGPPQGGAGRIQVLLMTKGHAFNPKDAFFGMFDSFGKEITYTHVEEPAAQVFLDPKLAAPYDVIVTYAMPGRERQFKDDGTSANALVDPSPQLRAGMRALLQSGKGIVFFHHALAGWVHRWPEFVEIMGGACDWGTAINIRGVAHPRSGFHPNTLQTISIADKAHPITQGLGDSFEITDEAYTCPMFEDSVKPLLRTSWQPAPEVKDRHLNPATPFSNLFAWVKTAENSPIVYVQGGHGQAAWEDEDFRKVMMNAIRWAASPEARAWAKANPTRIFK
jgi:type 1 glutamine amidotransferase